MTPSSNNQCQHTWVAYYPNVTGRAGHKCTKCGAIANDLPGDVVDATEGFVDQLVLAGLEAENKRLREALEDAMRHVPDSATQVRRCIKSDPAGSDYEIDDAEWYVRAKAALAPSLNQDPPLIKANAGTLNSGASRDE